ncbi:uncharacterized protein Z520_00739 [Fonsecaea multimorphosa CBS 102226]|uniref:Uncharacterized protein n=1 Tax=Fonsecaea multimorphosa CBS 102226 TaxID=1442371 RepID=A0A0D2J3T4_9EURO|nr:uncharacterized protein Z520_00739 [Fonsecaea multimorphosa CBS 102226]KIY04047.1 hypothetical protein Z520_00739 [Fonsecaea multimorphosa CBS 102226]OAL31883.1 hypothetical protein AYO22_00753 [Fonsecaea multimorphosa]
MDALQQYHCSPPETTYNPAISANVSSYFVRPNKVVKPSSRNSSPRILGRRKTMTAAAASSRTRSVVDHLRSRTQWQNTEMPRSRPVSWHPNSFEALNSTFNPVDNELDLSTWDFSTAQVHGLVTPISYQAMNEPQIREPFTPLDELPTHDPGSVYESQPYLESMWLGQGQVKSNSNPFALYSQQSFVQPVWGFNQPVMAPNVQTAPSSPDCLPLQNFGLDTLSLGNSDSNLKDDSEELVAMGLYDSPAEVQSSSLLFDGSAGSARKGLKLEESFEPVEQEEEDEEDADTEDAEEDEAGQQDAQHDEDGGGNLWNTSDEYEAPSIADHLTFGMQAQPDSLAMKYLSTLRQLNSAYYPSGHSYGWA